MFKIDGAYAVTPQPAVGAVGANPDGYFQTRTPVDVDWLNTTMKEISLVITTAGLTLNKAAQNQLYLAVIELIDAGPPRPGITAIVEDTSPQLGGNLDVNGFNFVSDSDGDIVFTANGSGTVVFNSTDIWIGGELVHAGDTDTKIILGLSDAFDIRTGGDSRFDVTPVGTRFGGANVRIAALFDEDAMTSNSATAISTQQAAKAYVDSLTPPPNLNVINTHAPVKVVTNGDVSYSFYQAATNLASAQYTTEDEVAYIVQADGVLSKFYISCPNRASTGTPASNNLTIVLRKNNADTAVTFTLTGINDADSDTSTTVSVVAGDKIAWKVTNNFSHGASVYYQIYSSMLLTN